MSWMELRRVVGGTWGVVGKLCKMGFQGRRCNLESRRGCMGKLLTLGFRANRCKLRRVVGAILKSCHGGMMQRSVE